MRSGIAATFVLTLFATPVTAQEPTLADVAIPTPEAAVSPASDGAMDLRTAGMTGARVSITDHHDDRIFVAIDVPNGRHAGCFTPCVVLADAGAMHVQTGRVARIVELETGVDREIEVDPGWNDHARGLVSGWYALALGGAAVAIVGLVASLTNADSICAVAPVSSCDHSWSSYLIITGAALIGAGTLLELISVLGSMEGAVSTRPTGGTWTSVSLAPTLDASGRVGGQGAITIRF